MPVSGFQDMTFYHFMPGVQVRRSSEIIFFNNSPFQLNTNDTSVEDKKKNSGNKTIKNLMNQKEMNQPSCHQATPAENNLFKWSVKLRIHQKKYSKELS